MSDDLVKRLREGVFELNDVKTVCEANARMTLAAIAIERKDAALRVALEYLEKHKDRMHDKGVTPRHLTNATIDKIKEALK